MNTAFRRPTYSTRRADVARIALILALLGVGALGWHGLRPGVISAVVHSSVGCMSRSQLLAEVLRDRRPEQPRDSLRNCWSPYGRRLPLIQYYARTNGKEAFCLADDCLNSIGAVTGARAHDKVDDMDGDGRIEFRAEIWRTMVPYWAIVRTGNQNNELVGVVTYNSAPQQTAAALTSWWYDEDGDGSIELVVAPIPGSARFGSAPPAGSAVAVFEWVAPGGMLRARLMPTDGSVTFWTPADGRPVPFSASDDLTDVVETVLSPASAPCRAATSSPGE